MEPIRSDHAFTEMIQIEILKKTQLPVQLNSPDDFPDHAFAP